MVANSGNAVLNELIPELGDRAYRFRFSARRESASHLLRSLQEHRPVLEAFAEGNAEGLSA